ncbi:hypothetical protein ABZX56_30605 [Streptomyces parvulus]|uniref:hypothetical protein n=1 Tax=Streptomyces parvulus TaxID=146923 RepID=UPI0033BCBBAD
MAIRKQAEALWGAWVGRLPQTIRERVDLLGGARKAAEAIGVHPGTVRRWVRDEARAMPDNVAKAVKEMGGVDQAAQAAGVKPRTVKEWMRAERRGHTPGTRQAAHIGKLTQAATDKHLRASQRLQGNQAKLHDRMLASPTARRAAISPQRASRMQTSGAHLTITAKVTIDTGRRGDTRWRDINMNFRDDAMREPTQAWLGGDDAGAMQKLSDAFGQHYAPGTGWNFDEIRSMEIGRFNPTSGGVFPDPDQY